MNNYKFFNMSITNIISISLISLTTFFSFVLLYIIFSLFTSELENSHISNTEQIMQQLEINYDNYFEDIIVFTTYLSEYISSVDLSEDTEYVNQINFLSSANKSILNVSIFDLQGQEIYSNYPIKEVTDIKKEEWFERMISENQIVYISEPFVQNLYVNQNRWVVGFAQIIDTIVEGENVQAILYIESDFKALTNITDEVEIGDRGSIYIINENNELLYYKEQSLIMQGIKTISTDVSSLNYINSFYDRTKEDTRLITYVPLNYVDWQIVGVSYLNDVNNISSNILRYIIIIMLIAVLLIIGISRFISNKISDPIIKLQKYMKKVQRGNFDIQIDIDYGEKEVIELADTFNGMVRTIKELLIQIKKDQDEKTKSEIAILQSQINPHFLYNTLDSIVWMAENDDVINMVSALSKLFKISISGNRNIIDVEEEIEHVTNYMLIQKYRYKDKFSYNIDVADEVKELKTIKLILQPLVENSLYHGIEYLMEPGEINIKAFRDGNFLVFEVNDNGVGMSVNQIETMFTEKKKVKSRRSNGVGVRNINSRIKLSFGEDYGLKYRSEIDEGTTCQIILPIIERSDDYA